MTHQNKPLVRWARVLLVLSLITATLVACLGGGEEDLDVVPTVEGQQPGVPAGAPAESATLVCSQECRDRGQCGDTADGTEVVLLDRAEPTVQKGAHDLAVPAGTAVTVLDPREVTVVEEATGFEFPVIFYQVFLSAQTANAWVAPWCIEATVQ